MFYYIERNGYVVKKPYLTIQIILPFKKKKKIFNCALSPILIKNYKY